MLAFRPGVVPRALAPSPPSRGCMERRDAAAEPRDHGTSWAVGSVGFIMVARLTRFTRLTRRAVLEAPTVAIPGAKVQDETRQKRADQCAKVSLFLLDLCWLSASSKIRCCSSCIRPAPKATRYRLLLFTELLMSFTDTEPRPPPTFYETSAQ